MSHFVPPHPAATVQVGFAAPVVKAMIGNKSVVVLVVMPVDHGYGGRVTVRVMVGFLSSVSWIGGGRILLVTMIVVRSNTVIFWFHTAIAVVVIGGIVKVVVWTVRPTVLVVTIAPSTVTTVVVGHATSKDVV